MEFVYSDSDISSIDIDGIVVGVYEGYEVSTKSNELDQHLAPYFGLDDFTGKQDQNVLLYQVNGLTSPRCVLVGLGPKDDCDHEIIRGAASKGARTLRSAGARAIAVEAIHDHPQATIEGLILGLYKFDELKSEVENSQAIENVTLIGATEEAWNIGITIASSQNFARRLAEMPANIGTPSFFVDEAMDQFSGLENVTITAHDEAWAKERNMGSFLSVAAGTDEPAKFLEISYSGGSEQEAPIVLVGKGITFDTGGISLKSNTGMLWMRGDCGGAAAAIGTILAIAKLQLPVNVVSLTPLTENMPSGKATRPTDVITASNGKTIVIENTDAEGRLILADALVYADTFSPHAVVDIATLTGSIMIALGSPYAGVFSRSDDLWHELSNAGLQTYERFWRMPLDKVYRKSLDTPLADLRNTRTNAKGGASVAAMFLSEFVTCDRWAHIDIAGVAYKKKGGVYQPKGMTGMPVRALVQYIRNHISE